MQSYFTFYFPEYKPCQNKKPNLKHAWAHKFSHKFKCCVPSNVVFNQMWDAAPEVYMNFFLYTGGCLLYWNTRNYAILLIFDLQKNAHKLKKIWNLGANWSVCLFFHTFLFHLAKKIKVHVSFNLAHKYLPQYVSPLNTFHSCLLVSFVLHHQKTTNIIPLFNSDIKPSRTLVPVGAIVHIQKPMFFSSFRPFKLHLPSSFFFG